VRGGCRPERDGRAFRHQLRPVRGGDPHPGPWRVPPGLGRYGGETEEQRHGHESTNDRSHRHPCNNGSITVKQLVCMMKHPGCGRVNPGYSDQVERDGLLEQRHAG
jgi:hypothetical protein